MIMIIWFAPIHTHACTHPHMQACRAMHTPTRTHPHPRARTHAFTQMHAHTHIKHTEPHTHADIHRHTHAYIHTHTHSHTHTHPHTTTTEEIVVQCQNIDSRRFAYTHNQKDANGRSTAFVKPLRALHDDDLCIQFLCFLKPPPTNILINC